MKKVIGGSNLLEFYFSTLMISFLRQSLSRWLEMHSWFSGRLWVSQKTKTTLSSDCQLAYLLAASKTSLSILLLHLLWFQFQLLQNVIELEFSRADGSGRTIWFLSLYFFIILIFARPTWRILYCRKWSRGLERLWRHRKRVIGCTFWVFLFYLQLTVNLRIILTICELSKLFKK